MASLVKMFINRQLNKSPLKDEDQLTFLKRLYRLIKNGYALNEALDIISWDERMYDVVTEIKSYLMNGSYLDHALRKVNFHPMTVMYIYFVRMHGDLLTGLEKSMTMFEQRMYTMKRFKRVSRYPLLLSFIFIILLSVIKIYILPAYIELFQFHAMSNRTVEWTMTTINILLTFLFISLFIIVVVVSFSYIKKQKLPIEKQLQIYMYVPVFRTYLQMRTSFYFATHVSLLLKTGMSIRQIIEHLCNQTELPVVQHYAQLLLQHLEKGYYVNELFHALPFIDEQLAIIFQKHHDHEALERDLATYADFIAELTEQKISKVMLYIQPITFTFVGVCIIWMYLSLLWPMFQLIDTI